MIRFFKSAWGISIGTSLFSFMLTVLYDLIKSKPVLSTICAIIKAVPSTITNFLNYPIKVWWLLMGACVLVAVLYVKYRIGLTSKTIKPEFIEYTEDHFRHWRWSWGWEWSSRKKAWHVKDLKAHCPQCGTTMIDHSSYINGVIFHCPRCNFQARDDECDQAYEVAHVILDNLNRNHQ